MSQNIKSDRPVIDAASRLEPHQNCSEPHSNPQSEPHLELQPFQQHLVEKNSSLQDLSLQDSSHRIKAMLPWVGVVCLVYVLLVAVGLIGAGLQSLAAARVAPLFTLVSHPILGLMVGIVATALMQSSSTVTSIIVGLVAGGLPVSMAVPMVMGANVGTTLTNTLVSLGHVGHTAEFRRAFAAATVHDVFNLLAVACFLPFELLLHPLERLGRALTHAVMGSLSLEFSTLNPVEAVTQPCIYGLSKLVQLLTPPFDSVLLLLLGIALIGLAITSMGRLLKGLVAGRAKAMFDAAIGRGAIASLLAGALITLVVQSSSTTTSLMVPLAGAGIVELEQVYPFILGANVGTCITALLAATAIAGSQALPALEIAGVHLLFNILGVVLIYGIPGLRRLPLVAARALAHGVAERQSLALVYVGGVFLLLPGCLIGLTALR